MHPRMTGMHKYRHPPVKVNNHCTLASNYNKETVITTLTIEIIPLLFNSSCNTLFRLSLLGSGSIIRVQPGVSPVQTGQQVPGWCLTLDAGQDSTGHTSLAHTRPLPPRQRQVTQLSEERETVSPSLRLRPSIWQPAVQESLVSS